MEERNIVAIDLGTSKIGVTVAHVEGDNVRIIYYKETPSEGINQSCIYNEAMVIGSLQKAINLAQRSIGYKIVQAVVCLPKYFVRQQSSTAKISREFDDEITIDDIRRLMEMAKDNCVLKDPEKEVVYGAVAQSYSDGEEFQMSEQDIVGRYGEELEGNFKIFTGRKRDIVRCERVFSKINITPVKMFFTADATAKAVLRTSEMTSGVALIDLGAGATSVSIYEGGIMRYYSSIPFGGKIISTDIQNECAISVKLAENIKKGYGVCKPERLQNLSEKVLQISGGDTDTDKQISVKYLCEIVTERFKEIAEAVLWCIDESGFADKLRNGIVLTGGGANLGCCCNLLEEMSGLQTRVGYPQNRFSTTAESCGGIREPSAAVSVGMILRAKEEKGLACTLSEAEYAIRNVFMEIASKPDTSKEGTSKTGASKTDASKTGAGKKDTEKSGQTRVETDWDALQKEFDAAFPDTKKKAPAKKTSRTAKTETPVEKPEKKGQKTSHTGRLFDYEEI